MIRRFAAFILLLCLLLVPLTVSARSLAPLAAPPFGESWYSISMDNERTGFSHFAISMTAGGYEFSSDDSVRMQVLGFSREASSRATYLVNKDLSLKSFAVEQTIDGSPMRLQGEVTAGGVIVKIDSAGGRREKKLKTRGAVYPPAVLNLYPLMRGFAPGKKYRVQMLDVEEIKIKEVAITVLGNETLPGGVETIHLRNNLYPFVDNDIWVDLAGNTVRESVRDGLIITSAEDGAVIRQFILDAAIAKRDLVLDFSIIKVDPPLARPLELKKMALELSGFPASMPLLSDERQKGARLGGDKVLFTVERTPVAASGETFATGLPEDRKYLEPTDRILSNHSEIVAEKNRLLKTEKTPLEAVLTLTRWVSANVEERVTDSQTSLETLRTRQGNCQSHARLYVAFARAAGIPTRFVSGLVYVAGKGFLYHSWAESFVGHWLAVDPTLGQVPADATHVKLAEGDSPGEMAGIGGIIGRVKGKIVEETY
jgi:hypothetical protein